MKKAQPEAEILVLERNQESETFGFGVVFSDATLDYFKDEDPVSYQAITDAFAHWDDIDVHFKGEVHTSTGHGFSGMSRWTLLDLLAKRAKELGVEIRFGTDVSQADVEKYRAEYDLVLAADGVNSQIRGYYQEYFRPRIDWRPNRFVWLGTTFPFDAFTFYFKENQHGMYRVHAYRYEEGTSTFIVECTEDTFQQAGFDKFSEEDTVAYMAELFQDELKGHKLLTNRSIWRSFPTIYVENWFHGNTVLMGDAVHTAHFSIGSGTKLAMEDAIELVHAIKAHDDLPTALKEYEKVRKPSVESLQRAAQVSLEWFENTERYMHLEPTQFTFSLLTRSLRVTHDNLKMRDEGFVDQVDSWFAKQLSQDGHRTGNGKTPPMFQPYKLREMELENRVVLSPMCQYSAEDGTINDWHLVHLGSRAIGGAGLLITEMTDISREGRITPGCAGMYLPEHVEAWKRVTNFVHQNSRAKIALQLAHAGRKGATKLLWEGMDQPLEEGAWPIVSASALPYMKQSQVPQAMTRAQMDEVKADFVKSAKMAIEAGFDMLELHAAHGYLLASFISPLTNQRDDEYGGELSNRLKYPLEVFRAVREVWPQERPMSVRISATDWQEGGVDSEESIQIAKAFHEAGADIIDVSAGQTTTEAKPVYGRLFQTPLAERIRLEGKVPTMTVGNISSYTDVNSILAAGRADLCAIARGHLYDPYWTLHAAYEQNYPVELPNQYKSITKYNFRFK